MKKIITSIGMLVFVGALVVGATGAFFSDTETSTGNVFTAGAIDLLVDSEQHYNGNVCELGDHDDNSQTPDTYAWVGESDYPTGPCDGTWTQTNLGITHQFFDFDDVKPGDSGENTISLHIDNNDAYACVDIDMKANDDVTCVDPENEAEGVGVCNTDDADPLFDGELAQNLQFFAWAETDGDNVWEPLAGELPLFSNTYGPASDVIDDETYTLASPQTQPLPGGSTSYIGLAWCAGDFTGGVAGVLAGDLSCDGESMGNDAQTDSMVADITFRVEQARNNDGFSCEPEDEESETASLTIIKHVVLNDQSSADDAITASDFLMSVKDSLAVNVAGSPQAGAEAPGFTLTGLAAGTYTVSESGPITVPGLEVVVTYSGDCTSDTIVLAANDAKTCTVTNTYVIDETPSII